MGLQGDVVGTGKCSGDCGSGVCGISILQLFKRRHSSDFARCSKSHLDRYLRQITEFREKN